jgi:hypothetical protein
MWNYLRDADAGSDAADPETTRDPDANGDADSNTNTSAGARDAGGGGMLPVPRLLREPSAHTVPRRVRIWGIL